MHQALYRKWRPQTFDEVCGQEHITSILKYETEHHKFSHAYLFCGSRGTGKTTCAKILAKAVNCLSPVNGNPCNECEACRSIDGGFATDVLEMDAASNNGVEDIRIIRDEVVYAPSALRYRVYIVDEVHMLSGSAFNALLKTLEEPPEHVVFVLATTELHKLPATIVSRCQRFDFRRISTDVLSARLKHIADVEGIEYESESLRILAKLAQGGMRDAISLLELCAGARKKVTPKIVEQTVGTSGRDALDAVVRSIASHDFDGIFGAIDEVVRSSRDLSIFWGDFLSYYRDMLVIKTTEAADRYLDLTEHESAMLRDTCALFSKETLLHHCRVLDDTMMSIKFAGAEKRIMAEMALLKLCDSSLDTAQDSILSRISKLENAIARGITVRAEPVEKMSESVKAETISSRVEPTDTVVAAQEKKPSKADPSKTENAVTFKILRGWNEIAEQASSDNGAALGFLKTARAFVGSDGRVYLKFPNDFAKMMAEGAGVRENVRAAICLATQKNLQDGDLIYTVLEANEAETDLDEFEIEGL